MEIGDILKLAPLPHLRAGWGGRELAGSFLVLRPFQRPGEGGGQETTLTQDNLSYVLSSTNIKRYIPKATTFLIAMMDSPFFPSFPSPLNRKLSLAISPVSDQSYILITPGDQWLSQWGLGQGTHESAFLSPTEEAQLKFPGW